MNCKRSCKRSFAATIWTVCTSVWISLTPASIVLQPGRSELATHSKALLLALLEPTEKLQQLERDGDFTARLALMEEQKTMPLGAVWDHYCQIRWCSGRCGVA